MISFSFPHFGLLKPMGAVVRRPERSAEFPLRASLNYSSAVYLRMLVSVLRISSLDFWPCPQGLYRDDVSMFFFAMNIMEHRLSCVVHVAAE